MIPEHLWHDIVGHIPICCVDVAIVHNGAALLVLRNDPPAQGQWWIPGGRLLKGESLATCAWRKALQETGLDCLVGPVVHRAELEFGDGPGGHGVHAVATCFLLTPKDGRSVSLDGTSRDYAWCDSPSDFWADMGEGEPQQIELHQYVRECLKGAGLW